MHLLACETNSCIVYSIACNDLQHPQVENWSTWSNPTSAHLQHFVVFLTLASECLLSSAHIEEKVFDLQ